MMLFQTQITDADKNSKRKKNSRPSSSGMLYFILSFFISLIIFVGISLLFIPKLPIFQNLPFADTTQTTTPTTAPTSASRFSADDRFSMSVYITDNVGELQSLSLVMVQPDNDAITVCAIPAQFGLPDTDTDTLARRFETGGAESAQMALNSHLGKTVDYYAVFSYEDVESYFTALNEHLIMTLTKNVDQQSADGSFSIHLTEGEQALTPKQTANLLQCDTWQGGRRERADMHSAVIAAYINQFVSKDRTLSADHETLLSIADTNFGNERFAVVETPLSYLAKKNDGALCKTLVAEGTFEGAGDSLKFTPDDSFTDTITNTLR